MPPQFSCVPLRSTSENCAVLPCFSDFGCFPTAHFLTFPPFVHRCKGFLILALITGIIVTSATITQATPRSTTQLKVPSIQQILKSGYPTNARGETYGPDTHADGQARPDLQLACSQDGTAGYIRFSDIYDYTPEPDNENVGRYINMYLQDGSTIIGSFYVSSGGITNN